MVTPISLNGAGCAVAVPADRATANTNRTTVRLVECTIVLPVAILDRLALRRARFHWNLSALALVLRLPLGLKGSTLLA
jgi:hypothetical protein